MKVVTIHQLLCTVDSNSDTRELFLKKYKLVQVMGTLGSP